ncbi:MAG: hypothetical protein SGJ20_20055 [Planctomycetota bacterium]|nr:hypothetical protein [Planctomycetota bacterium]
MKIQKFLEHHGIGANPFSEEDAQTDPVFKEHCIASTYHPTWDKIYGNPADPSTSVIFGEKGSGKTALRLQIARHLEKYNSEHPTARLYTIEYDDFNPFLDRFRDTLSKRKQRTDRVLAEWKLWDHMDAILSLAVTRLVDRILTGEEPLHTSPPTLDQHQSRDLLLLAACYDQSSAETAKSRWGRLRRKLRFPVWKSYWDLAVGILVTVLVAILAIYMGVQRDYWDWLITPWPYLMVLAGWGPRLWRAWKWHWQARGVVHQVRVGNRETRPLRQVLMQFSANQISSQPLPNKQRTDDRYELLVKLQGVLKSLGYTGMIVLVDRVDEPHLINGSADQMRALLWPMLDNKFLKHPGIGFKLLLPIELTRFIDREERDFYQRSRLDKQNLIMSLEWTGEALYDVANARIRACAVNGATPSILDLLDQSISDRQLIDALRSLRVPRHLFKFLYRVLVAHCNAHTDDQPVWRIPAALFDSTLALYRRDQDAFDRGVGAV